MHPIQKKLCWNNRKTPIDKINHSNRPTFFTVAKCITFTLPGKKQIWQKISAAQFKAANAKFLYQLLLRLADFCVKVSCLVVVCVAVGGAKAAEEGGRKLEALCLLLFLWRWFFLPHHLAVRLWRAVIQSVSRLVRTNNFASATGSKQKHFFRLIPS